MHRIVFVRSSPVRNFSRDSSTRNFLSCDDTALTNPRTGCRGNFFAKSIDARSAGAKILEQKDRESNGCLRRIVAPRGPGQVTLDDFRMERRGAANATKMVNELPLQSHSKYILASTVYYEKYSPYLGVQRRTHSRGSLDP